MNTRPELLTLAERLDTCDLSQCRVVTGFDGFVDEMITLVAERRSLSDFSPVPDISSFGQLVTTSAGHSSLREIVVNATHAGGCSVNLADGLASLGVPVDCFATLGDPIHGAFREVGEKCGSFHSWGREPGRTLAFEFADGKLMYSAVSQLAEFTVEAVHARLQDGIYQAACARAQVVALTNWTLYPHMTAVWQLLQREVYAHLENRPSFMLDLVDPSGRSAADIREMTDLLRGFEPAGPVTLGLNGNEANILTGLLGGKPSPAGATPDQVVEQAEALRIPLGISRVAIHQRRFAVAAEEGGGFIRLAPYCENPQKSTGAGDRFNAGLSLGLALGLSTAECLTLGGAVAGFFVRHARSASLPELTAFLRKWAEDAL